MAAGRLPEDAPPGSLHVAAVLGREDERLLPEAASRGRFDVVRACLAAGFPVDTAGEQGDTALHHASIRGDAGAVRALLARGADPALRDAEHDSTALGWAVYGRGAGFAPDGRYADCIRALGG